MSFQDLITLDKSLFKWINGTMHHPWLDAVLPIVRTSQTWYPLYVFLILMVLANFKKGQWVWLLFVGLLPVVTDLISSRLIKEHIFRLRPCNDPSMLSDIRFLLGYKPQSSSFTSSHAANHFALAVFFYGTLKQMLNKWAILFLLWATMICWAQVYVGVHFPGDVLAGGMLGAVIGSIVLYLFNKKIEFQL